MGNIQEADKLRLNHELLLWRGFTLSNGVWSYPDGVTVDDGVPFFPDSLDAIFKWLKPAVIKKGVGDILTWRKVLNDWLKIMAREKAMDDEPALPLCLAVQKLIRSK